jgi:hypothetical protein
MTKLRNAMIDVIGMYVEAYRLGHLDLAMAKVYPS